MTRLTIGRSASGLANLAQCRLPLKAFERSAGANFLVFTAWLDRYTILYFFTVLAAHVLLTAHGQNPTLFRLRRIAGRVSNTIVLGLADVDPMIIVPTILY